MFVFAIVLLTACKPFCFFDARFVVGLCQAPELKYSLLSQDLGRHVSNPLTFQP